MNANNLYRNATEYLFNLERLGIKLGLQNIAALLDQLDNPHRRFPSIHIAGTNGKGSTAAILESILRRAGFRTGLYTSPHLVDFRERIRVCGRPVEEDVVIDFVRCQRNAIQRIRATFFEVTTALSFHHFATQDVEIAIVETGLGGRLDATNVLNPELSLITTISLDHTELLGCEISQIASEKAGIIKCNVPTILGDRDPTVVQVIAQTCQRMGSELIRSDEAARWSIEETLSQKTVFSLETSGGQYEKLSLPLIGSHQLQNAAMAILAAERMAVNGWTISAQQIKAGVENVRWPGRMDIIKENPCLMLDVAHNPAGAKALANGLSEIFPKKGKIFVIGILSNKDIRGVIQQLEDDARLLILTRSTWHKAADPSMLAETVTKTTYHIAPSVPEALSLASDLASPEDLICVTGSHFTVGETMEYLGLSPHERMRCPVG